MTTYIPQLTLPAAIFDNQAVSILLPVALGTAVGLGTRPKKTQATYKSLKQPTLAPPPYVFGPVWTLLYGLMGYAAHRAVHLGTSPLSSPLQIRAAKHAATLYTVQLGLNLVWMPLFFGLGRPVEATADIAALLGVNGYLTYLYSLVDPTAAWLQVPYLTWLAFATYLSAGTGYLNGWKVDTKGVQEGDVKKSS